MEVAPLPLCIRTGCNLHAQVFIVATPIQRAAREISSALHGCSAGLVRCQGQGGVDDTKREAKEAMKKLGGLT